MNYIKPEDIKEYVSKNPEGIAGMSEELAVMVNHFAELIVRECAKVSEGDITDGDACCTNTAYRIARQIKKHFGVEE